MVNHGSSAMFITVYLVKPLLCSSKNINKSHGIVIFYYSDRALAGLARGRYAQTMQCHHDGQGVRFGSLKATRGLAYSVWCIIEHLHVSNII